MAKKKRKSKSTAARGRRKAAKKAPETEKPLTKKQVLARMPKTEYLSTRDLQHVFGVHEVTVYRWKANGDLGDAYRRRSTGRATVYSRENVLKMIDARFDPQPISESKSNAGNRAKTTSAKPRSKAKRKVSKRKPKAS